MKTENKLEELKNAADYARQAYLNTDLAFKTAREVREAACIRMFDTAQALDSAIDYGEDK